MTSRTQWWRKVGTSSSVVVIIASILTLAVCLWPRSGNTPVGQVESADYVFDVAHSYRVELPTGTLELEVRPPADKLDGSDIQADSLDSDDDVVAGHGRKVVALSWSFQPDYGQVVLGNNVRLPDNLPEIGLSLTSGGPDIDIASISADPASQGDDPQTAAYTVVDGDGAGLGLDVEFDGLVQHVDVDSGEVETGTAAPLYDAPRTFAGDPRCSTAPSAKSGFSARPIPCAVSAVELLPWVPGLGWVPDTDTSWAVVSVDARLYGATYLGPRGGQYTDYAPTAGHVEVRLDGAEPRRAKSHTDATRYDTSTSGSYVFELTADPSSVTVDRRYRLTPGYGRSRDRTLRLHHTTTLHER